MDYPQFYRLTPPGGGKVFYAVVMARDERLVTVSNRHGHWIAEPPEFQADLAMPEFKLAEWDVDLVDRSEVPAGYGA